MQLLSSKDVCVKEHDMIGWIMMREYCGEQSHVFLRLWNTWIQLPT